ncbi:MAG: hypothetical protein Fur0012_10970 [Elusimicrobiota bacterium]
MCHCLAKSGALCNIYERKGFLYDEGMSLGELESFVREGFLGETIFTFEHPKNYVYLPENGRKIGFLVYEFTELPPIWVENINKYLDLVFVPSLFVYETFLTSGVKKDKLRILRYGFNPVFYHPGPKEEGNFRFLCIGSAQKREGVDILLSAFEEAFRDISEVSLTIKLSYKRANPKIFELRGFEGLIEDYKKMLGRRLSVLDSPLSEEEMGNLYRCCHAYVSFSRAEAFGLSFLEALACGRPCISVNYSGQKDFLNRDNSYFVSHSLEICKNEEYESSGCKQFSAVAHRDCAVKTLREVFLASKDGNIKKGFFSEGEQYYHWEKITMEFLSMI